jgi:hypothetical protein
METLIFLIIVGILSSILGKGKGRNISKGRSFLPNGFEEFKTLIQKQMEHPPITTVKQELSKPLEKKEETIEEKYHQVKEIVVKENQLSRNEPDQMMPVIESQKQRVQDEKNIMSNDSNTILNGLIWSEILGEPRSRKPHFPRK